jgi:type IV secretion system protein VirD4
VRENRSSDVLVIGVVGLVLGVCGAAWLGAWTATTVTGGLLDAPFTTGLAAAYSYITQPARPPAVVWDDPDVPGPAMVYIATGAWLLLITGASVGVGRVLHGPASGYAARRRLGTSPEAAFARPRHLATLRYRRPVPGRFILGRAGSHTLASVNPRHRNNGLTLADRACRWLFARHRAEAFGAIALIGLSQTGKSQHALTALRALSAAGCPMICSSVKGDIVEHLLAQRRRVGAVGVFDPTGNLQATYQQRRRHRRAVPPGWDERLCIGWSPLDGVTSYDHAVAASHRLAETGPDMGNVTSGDFWRTQAEILIAPLLWIAARTQRDMGDVTLWVLAEARPDPDNDDPADTPEPVRLLHTLLTDPDPATRRDADQAEQVLYGLWNKAATTVGSVYATSNTILKSWTTEQGRHSSLGQLANLDWLLAGTGNNTLFISAPPQEQRQLRPVLTAAVSSILDDIYRHTELWGPLDPPLVVFLDEAGNAPLARLPEYLSTLASAGVLIITVWQDVAQIRKAYSDHHGSILSNSRHVLVFGGSKDPATLDWVRQILGDEQADTTSRTSTIGDLYGGSISTSAQRVSLTPANVLREMPRDRALLISANNPPAEIRHIPEHTIDAFKPLRNWPHPPDTTLGLPTTATADVEPPPGDIDPATHLATTFDSPIARAIAHLDLLHALWPPRPRQPRRPSSSNGSSTSGSGSGRLAARCGTRTQPGPAGASTAARQPTSTQLPSRDHAHRNSHGNGQGGHQSNQLAAVTDRERRARLHQPDGPEPEPAAVPAADSAGIENLI